VWLFDVFFDRELNKNAGFGANINRDYFNVLNDKDTFLKLPNLKIYHAE
jgi:hypothetical protein